MKHLNSKILAAVVACLAIMLLNVNVYAASESNQQPSVKRSRSLGSNLLWPTNGQSRFVIPRNQSSHHYSYHNLTAIKSHPNAEVRLGARRSRRTKRPVKRNRRHVRRQSCKGHHSVKQNRSNKRQTKHPRNDTKTSKQTKNNQPHYPRLIKPRERVINQKKSAVSHFKKHIRYVDNAHPANFESPGTYGDSDYGRTGAPITGTTSNGDSIKFNRLTFLPKKLGKNQFYSPQGLVVIGPYAYVITNATNSYESIHDDDTDSNKQAPTNYVDGDNITSTSPYKLGASQIIQIDMRGNVKDYNENLKAVHHYIKVGPVFYGGHGEGFAYNLRNGSLWLLNNKQGQVTKTAVSLINRRTLLPKRRINFHFGGTTIGDDLAFAKNGKALNVTEAGGDSFAKQGSIKFFKGLIKLRRIRMRLVKQALRWAPSDVIQGLAYNRRNNRLYILGDDSITSVPVNRLGHLRAGNVWNTQFDTTREFEGLSFDRKGNCYLLTNRSPEILKSRYNQALHF